MRGLIVDYFGVLDGTDEDRENWRSILTGARANDVRLAVLSNEPEGPGADRVREEAREYGIDHVVLSGAIGVEKPEPEAFLEAARRLELEPRECVMVDDAIENVLGAVQTGMIGVFYQVFDRAAVEIRGLLGLDEAV
ncbi:HAD-IA family hydrolase [Dietzia cinnamea]|uniref:HAD family hydrolase n=1 Tax=Dietzia TaxID=37914 RepID=UPI000D09221B|nr:MULTISPECIES: HAD-IA family hydrolase [Dietzia]AVM64773.1 HAD family hydrolase [Dietzia sp. oral taxon 368]MCT1712677.1 HAD-IA family hydrolase [Dietzia cinnamea]